LLTVILVGADVRGLALVVVREARDYPAGVDERLMLPRAKVHPFHIGKPGFRQFPPKFEIIGDLVDREGLVSKEPYDISHGIVVEETVGVLRFQ
jgi:hypothetical protein